jgi:cytosine/adenosine deaminase-related metal-dependent hydrolase
VDAAGIFDAAGVGVAPGSILLELGKPAPCEVPGVPGVLAVTDCKVLAVGTPDAVDRHPAASSIALDVIRRRTSVLIPGLVNAHAHLDLTHLGPVPHDPVGGFSTFVDRVRAGRLPDGEELAASVRLGTMLSLRGGVVAVGDIAGAPGGFPALTPYQTLAASGLAGVSFLEFFAVGRGEVAGLERLTGALDVWRLHGGTNEFRAVRLGIQPHAPYSVMPEGYRRAIELAGRDLPLATHLAETLQEREFVAHGTGPQRALLERIGVWQEDVLRHVGQGRRPVGHVLPMLRKAPFLCAHLNDLNDREIDDLAQAGATAVYCPRASAYFGATESFGPHRYRDLLAAGVPVALGTDSIVNLPSDAEEGRRLSTLDEMRLVYRRDGGNAVALLGMGTVHGARVLGLPDRWVRLGVGNSPRGLVAVEIGAGVETSLGAAFEAGTGPELLLLVRNSLRGG